MKRRVKLTLEINLDPVPGAFHDMEDMKMRVERMLKEAVPWYDPEVTAIEKVDPK